METMSHDPRGEPDELSRWRRYGEPTLSFERRKLGDVVCDLSMQRAFGSACALWYGSHDVEEDVGTGNLITHNGNRYILTCEHVAKGFFNRQDAAILFSKRLRLRRDQVEYHRHNKGDDIAILKIVDNRFQLRHLEPLLIRDFQFEVDFSSVRTRDFIVTGYPSALVAGVRQQKRAFTPLTYLTVRHPTKTSSKHKLVLDYRVGANGQGLPEPNGLSGSLVWEVFDLPDQQGRSLWHPGQAIALQFSGNKQWIRGSTLRKLAEWLT